MEQIYITDKSQIPPNTHALTLTSKNSEIGKKPILSLFGSMPPKGDSTGKKWSEIRKQAKQEYFE